MGKGDRRSKKGKRYRGSHGVTRTKHGRAKKSSNSSRTKASSRSQ